jgi:transposase
MVAKTPSGTSSTLPLATTPTTLESAAVVLEASSGKTVRHRLNRGGDRDANNALWTIAMTRLSCDERTQRYLDRRTAEGKSKREIIRCLKRYIAREVYRDITAAVLS